MSEGIQDQFHELLSQIGVGLANSGIDIAKGLIGGDTTALSAMVPQEYQPFLGMLSPLIAPIASGIYDSALGYDKDSGQIAPSDFVGKNTIPKVYRNNELSKLRATIRRQLNPATRRIQNNATRQMLAMVSGKTGAEAAKWADEQINSGSGRAKLFQGITAAAMTAVTGARNQMVSSYVSHVGSDIIEGDEDLHTEMMHGLASEMQRKFVQADYGYNSAADVGALYANAIQRNAEALRTADKKTQDRIQKSIQTTVQQQADAMDKLRSMFGKNASVEQITASMSKLGYDVKNMSGSALASTASRLERLSVNMGTTAADLATYRQGIDAHLSGMGIAPGSQIGAGAAEFTATQIGRGITMLGVTTQDVMRTAATQAASLNVGGQLDTITAAMDLFRDTKQEGRFEDSEFAKVRSAEDLRALAAKHGIRNDYVDLLLASAGDSPQDRDAATKFALNRRVRDQRAAVISFANDRLAKRGGGRIDAKWLNKLASADRRERAKMLLEKGLSYEDLGLWRFDEYDSTNAALFAFSSIDNQKRADRAVESSKGKTYSRMSTEAALQYINKHGDKATAAGLINAVFGNVDIDTTKLTDEQRKKASEMLSKFGGDKNLSDKDKKVVEEAQKALKTSESSAPKTDQAPSNAAPNQSQSENGVSAGNFVAALQVASEALTKFAKLLANMSDNDGKVPQSNPNK